MIAPAFNMSEFSDVLQRLGEENEAKKVKMLTLLDASLPAFIVALPDLTPDMLFDDLEYWFGGRSDPRETEARQKYYEAVKAEMIRRMISK